MLVAQARDRHHDRLALLERPATDVGLRRVGVRLDHLGALPGPMPGEPLRPRPWAGEGVGTRPSPPGRREPPSRSPASPPPRLPWSLDRSGAGFLSPATFAGPSLAAER